MKKANLAALVELPIVSNPHSIPCFDDFMAEAKRCFEVECDAKNRAYTFILKSGFLKAFVDFCRNPDSDPHGECLRVLKDMAPDKEKKISA